MSVVTSSPTPQLTPPPQAFWNRLQAAPRRVLLLDYDGTLAPLRIDRARARPVPGVVPTIRRILALQAAEVIVVSGRPCDEVATLLGRLDVEILGTHGWERRARSGHVDRRSLTTDQEAALARAVKLAGASGLGGRLEAKYASVAIHTRGLSPATARDVEVLARRLFMPLTRSGQLDVQGFDGGVELRARGADKGTAVRGIVDHMGTDEMAVYLGDDVTDEDAFEALGSRGIGILVRAHDRPTRAAFRLGGPTTVVRFLERVATLQAADAVRSITQRVPTKSQRLVVVSNRLPEIAPARTLEERRAATVGGLVSALRPALEGAGESIWVGWSGRSVAAQQAGRIVRGRLGRTQTMGIDLATADVEGHYNGFCNRALWPLFHCFTGRAAPSARDHTAYVRVNALFARALARRLKKTDLVWVHDYHLMPLGLELRRRGFTGSIGFFLHIPFPPGEIFQILPSARELLEAMLSYDLVGFHTESYALNYTRALRDRFGGDRPEGSRLTTSIGSQHVGAYPIGIDPEPYGRWASEDASRRRGRRLRRVLRGRKIILGVDRLDYTKGIVERLRAFAMLLEIAPRLRNRVSFIQISAPSRTRVPEYIAQRREVEELVGHINGKLGAEDWVPVRFLYRSYSQRELAALYREADVCLVSPLRDGMNLVAKEYVAAQTGDPGVLVLSCFAGASEELTEALIVNPYDIETTARTLWRALVMPVEERARRQAALLERVKMQTATRWAETFLRDLVSCQQ